MGKLEKFMLWVNVLVIFAMFFAYLSPFINPRQFWQFSFFGLIYPWLLLGNIIMVSFWGVRKKKYLFLSLICIISGWGHVTSFVGLNFFEQIKAEKLITIGTYNVKNLVKVRIGKKGSETRILQENDFIDLAEELYEGAYSAYDIYLIVKSDVNYSYEDEMVYYLCKNNVKNEVLMIAFYLFFLFRSNKKIEISEFIKYG